MRWLSCLLIILMCIISSYAYSQTITLTWEKPITNADETLLTDLVGYRLYRDGELWVSTDDVEYVSHEFSSVGSVVYDLVAYDSFGNESEFDSICIITDEAIEVTEPLSFNGDIYIFSSATTIDANVTIY